MTVTIDRHKAAISRNQLSKPIYVALQQGVITSGTTIFDYGCGKGDDLRILREMSYDVAGWDPHHSPDTEKKQADIVNLGYVINVIENFAERKSTLKEAYSLANKCLVVSAQVLTDGAQTKGVEYNDGVISARNTFQKYYSQSELREYIETSLNQEAVPASLGVFYVFKDEIVKETFIANRYIRRYIQRDRRYKTTAEKLEPHKELLEQFANRIEQLGRIPKIDEFDRATELKNEVGSFKKCAMFCQELFEEFDLETIERNKRDDLLVFLALSNMRKKPKLASLDESLQRDIKYFFGTFKKGLEEGKTLLYQLSDHKLVSQACANSPIGKKLPDSLYIHTDYIQELAPILRVFVGCATAFAGELKEANIIKINKIKRKISFMNYIDFDDNPHPALSRSIVIDLMKFTVKEWIQSVENPPILHRKETFVGESHPGYSKFCKLTKQEEKAGLLSTDRFIGRRNNWSELVAEMGYKIQDHKLMKLK